MARRILLITLELVAVSVPLTWLWLAHLQYEYAKFFQAIAQPFFAFIGMGDIPIVFRTRFINIVPFIAMILVTPNLGARRKSLGILLGSVAILAGHLAFTGIAGHAQLSMASGGSMEDSFPVHIAGMLLSDSMPLLLWLIIAGPALAQLRKSGPGGFRLFPAPRDEAPEGAAKTPEEELS